VKLVFKTFGKTTVPKKIHTVNQVVPRPYFRPSPF